MSARNASVLVVGGTGVVGSRAVRIPAHEVIVEIDGARGDGTPARSRHVLSHDDVHAAPSATGAALAVERILGLAGGERVAPGLYNPEQLLDPAYVVERLLEFGTRVTRG